MPELITSRENTLLKTIRRMATDNQAYRKLGQVWIEGDHLCRAALDRGFSPAVGLFAESIWSAMPERFQQVSDRTVVVPDRLFQEISGLESPSRMGFVLPLPSHDEIIPNAKTIVLDRVQDAGNVGSILRSAAAFGFHQVVAIKGSAALWSAKVLRAGMGAHFALQLIESQAETDLEQLKVPLIATSSHTGGLIHRQKLPTPCAWVFGHEGQGVSQKLLANASLSVQIGQPGGEESLNVAAAAAICLFASSIQVSPL